MMAGMITLILTGLLRGVRTQRSLVLENLALRHQLVVLQRTVPRPRLRTADCLFLSRSISPLGLPRLSSLTGSRFCPIGRARANRPRIGATCDTYRRQAVLSRQDRRVDAGRGSGLAYRAL